MIYISSGIPFGNQGNEMLIISILQISSTNQRITTAFNCGGFYSE